jgi:hypothetical protein
MPQATPLTKKLFSKKHKHPCTAKNPGRDDQKTKKKIISPPLIQPAAF